MKENSKIKYKLRKRVFLAGDCHGQLRVLSHAVTDNILPDSCDVICLGDLGQCKPNYWEGYWKRMNTKAERRDIRFYLIRGNHDMPGFFKHANSKSNVIIVEDYDEFAWRPAGKTITGVAVGGAVSVDRSLRWENSWFWSENEGMPDVPHNIGHKDFVVSHTGITPPTLGTIKPFDIESCKEKDKNLISDLLDEKARYTQLLSKTTPDKAFYGHYHMSAVFDYLGVECRVLNIDELYELIPWKCSLLHKFVTSLTALKDRILTWMSITK